jgi:phosphatidate cytidylyltransferase
MGDRTERPWARRLPRWSQDLNPRAVSGLTLACLALALLYAGPTPFAGLVVAIALLMCWEWGRIVRGTAGVDAPLLVHASAVAVAAVLTATGSASLALAVVVVGAGLVWLLCFGLNERLCAVGVLYVGLPAVSLVWLRADEPYGLKAVLFLLLIVATTDTFAYVGGRLVGGPKLWPSISPNKTWSGLLSGIAASAIAGAVFAAFASREAVPAALAFSGFVLGLVAQAGDLAESALKRRFGVKDASSLIPGHGGFLDRLDGVVFAVTLAALVALLINNQAPARAILLWS